MPIQSAIRGVVVSGCVLLAGLAGCNWESRAHRQRDVASGDGVLADTDDVVDGADTGADAVMRPTNRAIGDPCDDSSQCRSRTCLPRSDGYPSGYCSVAGCRFDTDCDAGSYCLVRPAYSNICVRECDSHDECRDDYECVRFNTGSGCVPALVSAELGPRCDSTLLEFNATGVAFSDGFRTLNRHLISFDIPADTASFLVVAWDRNGLVFPETLTTPDGRILTMSEYAPLLYTAAKFDYIAPVLMPAIPAYDSWVMEGRYDMTFGWNGLSRDDLCFAVIPERRSEPVDAVQKLNITFYFAASGMMDESNAIENEDFIMLLDRVDSLFNQASIEIGDLRLRGFPGVVSEAFQYLRSVRAVHQLCELTVLPDGDAEDQLRLNVVMIDGFIGDLSGVLGISAGIVGGAGSHGSASSCVVVAGEGLVDPRSIEYVGSVLAHEIGHYLGLFHTTEMGMTVADPLEDTPDCLRQISDDMADCPDVDNFMFPMAYPASANTITPQQTAVMRANPLTRPVAP